MKPNLTKYLSGYKNISEKNRKRILATWLVILFSGICSLFWYNEWVYSLPTPVPQNYHNVKPGTYIDIEAELHTGNNKPCLLHFFNPDCPCSKFNIPHFKSLVKQYGDKANFVVVAMCKEKNYSASDIQNKFGLTIPVLFDTTLATACGVYSTPQAVLLDSHYRLYYRGNYNKSRYCSDESTDFAKMALDSLLNNNPYLNLSPLAFTAYGCQLPKCTYK